MLKYEHTMDMQDIIIICSYHYKNDLVSLENGIMAYEY